MEGPDQKVLVRKLILTVVLWMQQKHVSFFEARTTFGPATYLTWAFIKYNSVCANIEGEASDEAVFEFARQ